jgi:hypothetical protein
VSGALSRTVTSPGSVSVIRGDGVNAPINEAGSAGSGLGSALASGDFNGDGQRDLAIGAPSQVGGRVRVLFATLPTVTLAQGSSGKNGLGGADEAGDQAGYELVAADFNGDGFDDLAVGVPGEALNGNTVLQAGSVRVKFGSSTGFRTGVTTLEQRLSGLPLQEEPEDLVGMDLSAGDFNGDDKMDLVIGVPLEDWGGSDVNAGLVMVKPGPLTGPASDVTVLAQEGQGLPGVRQAGDNTGWATAGGDFNGDGIDDVVISAPGENSGSIADVGRVFVKYGPIANGPPTILNVETLGQFTAGGLGDIQEAGDRAGYGLTVGDFDGNTVSDLAVGIPFERNSTGASNAGRVTVLRGVVGQGLLLASGTPASEARQLFRGSLLPGVPATDELLGLVLTAGNLRSTSAEELVIGSPFTNVGGLPNAGSVITVTGQPSGATGAATEETQSDDRAGLDTYSFGTSRARGVAALGSRPLLVIPYFAGGGSDARNLKNAPWSSAFGNVQNRWQAMLWGNSGKTIADYFTDVSAGRFTFTNAGASLPVDLPQTICTKENNDALSEAVTKAATSGAVNFAAFDADHNDQVDETELAIILVGNCWDFPSKDRDGDGGKPEKSCLGGVLTVPDEWPKPCGEDDPALVTVGNPTTASDDKVEERVDARIVGNVCMAEIPNVTEFCGATVKAEEVTDWDTAAHELSHLVTAARDFYASQQNPPNGPYCEGFPVTGYPTFTATSGTAGSIDQNGNVTNGTVTVNTAGWPGNQWSGQMLDLIAGSGAGQRLRILSNTATTITISGVFTTAPNATTVFRIRRDGCTGYTLMGTTMPTSGLLSGNVGSAAQLDAPNKFVNGWLNPRVVDLATTAGVSPTFSIQRATATMSRGPVLFYDSRRVGGGRDEWIVVEYRSGSTRFDNQFIGKSTPAIVIWRVRGQRLVNGPGADNVQYFWKNVQTRNFAAGDVFSLPAWNDSFNSRVNVTIGTGTADTIPISIARF